MKKIMFIAISILLLAACKKDVTSDTQALSNNSVANLQAKVTVSISDVLQSDPDPNPTTECGSALFSGTMTHLGKVHGISVNNSCTFSADYTQLAITSDDIAYAANGDELWTKGDIVIHFPTDGSTVATITGVPQL
jgi:hypothetical protein